MHAEPLAPTQPSLHLAPLRRAGATFQELQRCGAYSRWEPAKAGRLLAAYESWLRSGSGLRAALPQAAAAHAVALMQAAGNAALRSLEYCLGWVNAAQPQLSAADGERLLEHTASLAATACKLAVRARAAQAGGGAELLLQGAPLHHQPL